MALQYSLKSFLRQAPNDLLRRHLEGYGVGKDLPWARLTQGSIEPIYRAIEAQDEKVRQRIECEFYDIMKMANEAGVRMIIEEGRDRHHNVDLADRLHEMRSPLAVVFWTFLEHPVVFDVAKRLHHCSTLSRWRKRVIVPEVLVDTSREAAQALAERISTYYRTREGRGSVCRVDHYARNEKLYWFAYPEDYPTGRLVYDKAKRLLFRTQRPAFEVIFVYTEGTEGERSVDTWLRGDDRTFGDLLNVFGDIILGTSLHPGDAPPIVYNLTKLMNRDFRFPSDPEDGIEKVLVDKLRLRVMVAGNRRIHLEADTRADPQGVYDLLDDITAGGRLPRELLQVQWAQISAVFRDPAGGQDKKRRFTITHGDRCSLKHEGEDALLRKLLKRWEIDVSDSLAGDAVSHRPQFQRTLRIR